MYPDTNTWQRMLKATIIITIFLAIGALFGMSSMHQKTQEKYEWDIAEHGYQFYNNVIIP